MAASRDRSSACRLGAFAILLSAAPAWAEIGTDVGLGFSDNLGRLEDDAAQSERMLVARVGGETEAVGSAFEGDVSWELGGIDYVDDSFSDEPVVFVDGTAAFELVERRVTWSFQDQAGRQALDPFSPTTPDSREYVNFFVTGPQFLVPVSDAVAVDMALSYTDVWYEEQTLDNSASAAQFGLRFGLSPRQSLSLLTSVRNVMFDDQLLYDNYDQRQSYIEYEATQRRGSVRVAVGTSEVEGLDRPQTSPLVEMSWSRAISVSGNFGLELRKGFASAGDLFELGQAGAGGPITVDTIVSVSDPVELQHLGLQFDVTKPRTSFNVTATLQQQEFEGMPALDRDVTTYEARVTRDLTPSLSFEAVAFLVSQDFLGDSRTDDERRSSLGLTWELGRRSSAGVHVVRYDRTSTVVGSTYEENRVFLSFSYGAELSRLQSGL